MDVFVAGDTGTTGSAAMDQPVPGIHTHYAIGCQPTHTRLPADLENIKP
ncbi:MAG TPA: hypothetical protein VF292_05165 [Rhodanobacteraceae bacterium]